MEKIVGNEQEKIMRKVKESKYKQLDHCKEKKEWRGKWKKESGGQSSATWRSDLEKDEKCPFF